MSLLLKKQPSLAEGLNLVKKVRIGGMQMTWMDMELMEIAEIDRDEAMDGLDKKMKL